jgi:hypothetical protein
MEVRRLVLRSVLALAIGALFFWIALNVIDRGFSAVLQSIFP